MVCIARWFHWYSRGFSPLAVELLNARRAVDYLASRPDIDRNRIGATGRSGGGMTTFFLAAIDERIKARRRCRERSRQRAGSDSGSRSPTATASIRSTAMACSTPKSARMAAPRPQLLVNADADRGFPMDAFNEMVDKIGEIYRL